MPRPDVSHKRIPQILDAAAKVFCLHGIDGSSMNQVAAESGLSKANVYHYFRSKDEMVEALVERLFEDDTEHLKALRDSEEPVVEKLLNYTKSLADLLEQNSELYPILAEFKARAVRTESIQERLRNYFARYSETFADLLVSGVKSGELRDSIEPAKVADGLVALIEGCILLAKDTGRGDLHSLLTNSVGIYRGGLKS